MSSETLQWKSSQLRKYDNVILEQIPKYDFQNPMVDELIRNNQPVHVTGSNLIKSAKYNWSFEYLAKHFGKSNQTVFISKNHIFKYFDEKKILCEGNPRGVEFTPQLERVEMKMFEFLAKLQKWKQGDDRIYLQQLLNATIGTKIVEDFLKFDWHYVAAIKNKCQWGELTSNVLFISMEGNVTPCHYDEQQNLLAQVRGCKRCILFRPDQIDGLYPHPVYHPHDRQSMVDFENPDYTKHPKFRNIKGYQAVLEPGDFLYIPIYWWHHVESLLNGGPTINVNFWYKGAPTSLHYPLQNHQKIAVMRNVEKMLLEVLRDPKDLGPFLSTMVLGRYYFP